MKKNIIKIKIENELDVVLAYKRSLQLAGFCGIAMASQTKFATAVSEICRNVLEHVGHGQIQFNITELKGILYLEALISDRGRGINNLEELLNKHYRPLTSKGWGIYNSKKLVEQLFIESDSEKGTQVMLHKAIPHNHPPINNAIIQGWNQHFASEANISPYVEIKNQNMQLLELLDQIRLKNLEVEHQLDEIKNLNTQLQASNHEITSLLQERNVANAQLTAINQELDKFAYIISHDLKAPLFNIISLSAVLQESMLENTSGEINKVARMVQEQAESMEKFISDVLEYSSTGRNSISKSTVDLKVLLPKVIRFLNVPAHINIEVAPNLPVLFTEEIYLQQIFTNLLSNAIKYNDKPDGLIQITYNPGESFIQLAVTDNGQGIPLEDQQLIFEPYKTGSRHRNTSTGLGLSIVKKIVQLKNTDIWVESTGTNGTTVFFNWPVEELVES
ncbi:sensor histidine kinase [Adhaeribacter radiodurans]|uniref:histidine kinase n=1 Tax=Adhaeribacter radiodurans TaxID=2745197 RepID=A0A7L7L8K7_9BACT|nr:sensor histidine kinase [Adhaeribacter radiodurans]QMU29160.1 sensor histidine kinase [Adhaeribacter radiodurans]